MKQKLPFYLIFCGLAVVLALLHFNKKQIQGDSLLDQQAPLSHLGDTPLKHPRDYPVLVMFSATWCPSCQKTLPVMKNLGLPIYKVFYRDPNARKKYPAKMPKYIFDDTGKIGDAWKIRGVPQTFLLDKDNIIRWQHGGMIQKSDIAATLRPLIKRLKKN